MTDNIFNELYEDKKYDAVIAFSEIKSDIINSSDPGKYRFELADSYIHTGDYPKALEQYQLLRKQMMKEIEDEKGKNNLSEQDINFLTQVSEISILKEEFRIHLLMGDIPEINRYYNNIKELHESIYWDQLYTVLPQEGIEKLEEVLDGRKFQDGFRLELIQGKYLTNPRQAIKDMKNYVDEVAPSKKYNHIFKLRLFNELIGMLMKENQTIEARAYLDEAISIVDSLEYNDIIYPLLGTLSEYCFTLNDKENGKRLLKYYLTFINDTYDSDDFEYAIAHAKKLNYLTDEIDHKEIVKTLNNSSKSIRNNITKNFAGMTPSQREFYIEKFIPILKYGNILLENYTSEDLLKVVFDNNMFLRGLLLRSETSLYNAIQSMNDPGLMEKYQEYKNINQELIARQYISGLGNTFRKTELEIEINKLEKELANESLEFRRQSESKGLTSDEIRKYLKDNEIALQLIQGQNSYYAITLDKKGHIDYYPLGRIIEIDPILFDRANLYTNDHSTEFLKQLYPVIQGRTVYYTTDGLFNQVALNAIPIDDFGKTMSDISNLTYLSSILDLADLKNQDKFDLLTHNVMLWGGIEYGPEKYESIDNLRSIDRGDKLGYLFESDKEVTNIANLLDNAKIENTLISGVKATEKSFTDRSHKKDYILHISTHGFFHDNGAFSNPMQNAGILFAGSQPYWETDTLVSTIQENDGILRADEISVLDLNNCKLVVLSACKTGLGESNSEGVFGLQRAFKLAGVDKILMSLWNVDDRSTRELMTYFYKELIQGIEPNVALKKAQDELRHQGLSPNHWAPFIILN